MSCSGFCVVLLFNPWCGCQTHGKLSERNKAFCFQWGWRMTRTVQSALGDCDTNSLSVCSAIVLVLILRSLIGGKVWLWLSSLFYFGLCTHICLCVIIYHVYMGTGRGQKVTDPLKLKFLGHLKRSLGTGLWSCKGQYKLLLLSRLSNSHILLLV